MTSIQGRLTLWLLGSVVLLFGLHWLVTSRAPVIFTETYVATRLEHDGETLLPGISFDALGKPMVDKHSIGPIYSRPGSGHYYIVATDRHRLKSLSLGEADIDIPFGAKGKKKLIHLHGPDDQPLLVWIASVERDDRWMNIAIAEELTLLNEQVSVFRIRFGIVTLLLLAILLAAQRLIVRVSLAPLKSMGHACRKLEEGSIEALPEQVPVEIKPLVGEINRLVALMRQRLHRSRNSVGNLAHALKTPLALLSQIVYQNTERFDRESREQARTSVAMIGSIIDRELKRARLAGAASAGQVFNMHEELPSIVGLLKNVYADKHLVYETALGSPQIIYGDREDMLEMLGNLMDNASKWARKKVRISAVLDRQLTITVEDDGPGIDDSLRDNLTRRGARFDESTAGHGLGLSIVKDIVTQYGGTMQMDRSAELGGLKVRISFPAGANFPE